MGRLRKVSHKDVLLVSSVESADSLKDPFVPNDFADDGSNAMSLDCSGDDEEFDKALYNFYVNNKVKYLKRKLSSAGRRNVRRKRSLLVTLYMMSDCRSAVNDNDSCSNSIRLSTFQAYIF